MTVTVTLELSSGIKTARNHIEYGSRGCAKATTVIRNQTKNFNFVRLLLPLFPNKAPLLRCRRGGSLSEEPESGYGPSALPHIFLLIHHSEPISREEPIVHFIPTPFFKLPCIIDRRGHLLLSAHANKKGMTDRRGKGLPFFIDDESDFGG